MTLYILKRISDVVVWHCTPTWDQHEQPGFESTQAEIVSTINDNRMGSQTSLCGPTRVTIPCKVCLDFLLPYYNANWWNEDNTIPKVRITIQVRTGKDTDIPSIDSLMWRQIYKISSHMHETTIHLNSSSITWSQIWCGKWRPFTWPFIVNLADRYQVDS